MASNEYLVYCTFPDLDQAESCARELVRQRLAACCNLLPQLRSIYRWEEKLCEDSEVLMLAKTTRDRFDRLQERILSMHSYECPEVIAVPIEAGSAAYLQWLHNAVSA